MDPITRAMFMGAAMTSIDQNPLSIDPGDSLGGGYFAGYISHTANGVPTHALIVAPAASGYFSENTTLWKTSDTSTSGTSSEYDGAANTANMTTTSIHPAASYCSGLSIGGYTDWYLPARYELEIAYYNLKPTTASNNTGYGTNSYAVPKRGSNYTSGDPAQTSVAAFLTGAAEDFVSGTHWSSTQISSSFAWALSFSNGFQGGNSKTGSYYVRAFRKFAL